MTPNAIEQINALILEKNLRAPGTKKLDSQILLMLDAARPTPLLSRLPLLNRSSPDRGGRVLVDIDLEDGAALVPVLDQLDALGVQVLNVSNHTGNIRARVNLAQMELVAALPQVRFIDSNRKPMNNRSTSEGDMTHRANVARTEYGFTGAGQKVCVVSDGIDSVASRQASSDLPAGIEVLPGQAGSGDEGTAMLEIIHDLAPGARLGFATSNGGEAAFAQNILDLANTIKGKCDIIVDDTDYMSESPFQDGIVSAAINTVAAAGVVYFSSAGNSGNRESNNSGTWEGDFNAQGGLILGSIPGHTLHEFMPGITSNTANSPSTRAMLHWAEPWGKSGIDYDLYIMDATLNNVVGFSTNTQSCAPNVACGHNPFEYTEAAAPYSFPAGSRIIIAKKAGAPDRMLSMQWYRGVLTYATSGATRGHSTATGALSIAATPAAQSYGSIPDGPFPNPFIAANKVEVFSSDGPRRVFFDVSGNLLPGAAAGDFKSSGGVVRQKPDLTAADGVKTDTPGYGTFYGTSAAAPHAAAIAALVRHANPTWTAAQVRSSLLSTALDIHAPGWDPSSGAGIVMATSALPSGGPTGGALDVDGNGRYDALTDGLLMMRWLFGISGASLVNNATGAGATRTSSGDVTAWLEPRRALLDIDGNGRTDALTDGLMMLRFMFGLRGTALVAGAIGAGATRTDVTTPSIEAYIPGLMP